MRIIYWTFFSLFLGILPMQAQTNSTDSTAINWKKSIKNKRIVSLNTTPLLLQMIPFNRTNPTLSGPYSVSFARYVKKNQALTFAVGLDLTDVDFNDDLFLNLKMGWEKRTILYEHWYYTKAWDIFLSIGSTNTPSTVPNSDRTILGTGPTWGIGYNFNPLVGLHVETSFLMGYEFDNAILDFQFIPPVAVYFHVVIPKKWRRVK